MPRNLDPTLAAGLSNGVIQPAFLAMLTFNSGVEYVWSGVGDLVFNGHTYKGLGQLASVGAITEASAVQADGTSVTLAGIGLSQIDLPPYPATPPSPPFTPPSGQSVAWAFAKSHTPEDIITGTGPAYFVSGDAKSTNTGGLLSLTNGSPFAPNSVQQGWLEFPFPPEIPPNATITGVYPVIQVDSTVGGGFMSIFGPGWAISSIGSYNTGPNVETLEGQFIGAQITNTVPNIPAGDPTVNLGLGISFVGMAVYYEGTPLSKASLIYEALNDVRMGGPAKIWFGLMSNGAFLGAPYLVFSGTVDKPTVNIGRQSSSITLALENRLVNLQRPSMRRYTSADQRLSYPTDLGFNWVEVLNDIALRWGS